MQRKTGVMPRRNPTDSKKSMQCRPFVSLFRRILWIFLLAGLLLIPGFSPGNFRAPLYSLDKSHALRLLFSSAIHGKFTADDSGRGGLAALVQYARQTAEKTRLAGDSFLFVQGGQFLEAPDARVWSKRLFLNQLHIPDHTGIFAFGLDAREIGYLQSIPQKDRDLFPAVSFDYRKDLKSEKKTSHNPERNRPPLPFRIYRDREIRVWITSITGGPEPEFAGSVEERLHRSMKNQTGVDLFLILVPDPITGERVAENLFPKKPELPILLERPDPLPVRTYIWISDASENLCRRSDRGMTVCRVQADHIADFRFTFRNRILLGQEGRFYRLNDREYPLPYISPEREIEDHASNK